MSISFSGIGSGNDWGSLIDQLVALERLPIAKLQSDTSNANKQLGVVGELVSRLGSLSSRASAMSTTTGLWGLAATSSDPAQVKVTASGSSGTGSYAVRVEELARGESRKSAAFTGSSPGAAGSLSIAVGGGASVEVAFGAGDSLADIAARITDKVPGVTATALHDGTSYRLLIASQTTGATAGALTIGETGASLGLNAGDAVTQAARDAKVSVNGVTATSSTNRFTGVLPGVTFDVATTTPAGGSDVTITVGKDNAGLKQKVKDLAASYNSVSTLLSSQLAYTGARRGGDTLFGDLATQQLQQKMGAAVARAYPDDNGASLRAIGVTLNRDGTLAIDEGKLDAAIAADPAKVEKLLTGENGVAKALSSLADGATAAKGPYVARQESLRSRLRRNDESIERVGRHADEAEVRLRRQFAALDTALASYNSQISFLSNLTPRE